MNFKVSFKQGLAQNGFLLPDLQEARKRAAVIDIKRILILNLFGNKQMYGIVNGEMSIVNCEW